MRDQKRRDVLDQSLGYEETAQSFLANRRTKKKPTISHVYIPTFLNRSSRSRGNGESQSGLASHLIGRVGDIAAKQARI